MVLICSFRRRRRIIRAEPVGMRIIHIRGITMGVEEKPT
jgi:hypothetical protein